MANNATSWGKNGGPRFCNNLDAACKLKIRAAILQLCSLPACHAKLNAKHGLPCDLSSVLSCEAFAKQDDLNGIRTRIIPHGDAGHPNLIKIKAPHM